VHLEIGAQLPGGTRNGKIGVGVFSWGDRWNLAEKLLTWVKFDLWMISQFPNQDVLGIYKTEEGTAQGEPTESSNSVACKMN